LQLHCGKEGDNSNSNHGHHQDLIPGEGSQGQDFFLSGDRAQNLTNLLFKLLKNICMAPPRAVGLYTEIEMAPHLK
jgi:hypothetical protein